MKRLPIICCKIALKLAITGILTQISGCASIMSHAGPYQGYYPGVRTNVEALQHEQTGWAMTPLLLLDIPCSAVVDTLLLPYDAYRSGKDQQQASPRERVKTISQSEQNSAANPSNPPQQKQSQQAEKTILEKAIPEKTISKQITEEK